MIANIHPTTNIPYGVISGQSVPDLIDDIQSNGTDENWEAFKEELADTLQANMEDAQEGETVEDIIAHTIFDYCHDAEKIAQQVHLEEGIQARDIIDQCMDLGLADSYGEADDSFDYSYEDGPVKLQTSTLGGAILIWVIESPWLTWAPGCSPCVPNAGDLDGVNRDRTGSLCYCLSPDDMPGKWAISSEHPCGQIIVKIADESE